LFLAVGPFLSASVQAEEIRIGLIGLDTSHVIAFTKIFNDPSRADHVPGARVVAAWQGGSPDIHASWSRLERFTRELEQDWDVLLVPTIEELCQQVDAIMLTSVDGRPHLEQAKPVIAAGLPLFIDKPLAGSLRDAIEIFRLAEEAKVPVFTASSYRFHQGVKEVKAADIGELKGVISYGPAQMEPNHPDLFWYGIHPTEALFTLMGTGCETVVRTFTEDTDVVTGIWSGGRVGTLRGIRNAHAPSRVIAFGSKAVVDRPVGGAYAETARVIVEFFQTGVPPFPPEETIEMFAFMEAADESRRLGGVPVSISELLEKNSR
jgi:predicted dehydrogenase